SISCRWSCRRLVFGGFSVASLREIDDLFDVRRGCRLITTAEPKRKQRIARESLYANRSDEWDSNVLRGLWRGTADRLSSRRDERPSTLGRTGATACRRLSNHRLRPP